ncbi:MAG: sigma-70 family RNA polymerase sigma factor, partial [Caldimonas sp.]
METNRSAMQVPTAPASIADVVAHRAYLVRFAMRRLRDPMLAEDAVHDVFEAVLTGRASFAGRAALRSWLTAVLKNKIVDALRRSPSHESLDGDA